MKIIVSHDVDHITVWEHKNGLIIPKFLLRNLIEFIFGYISLAEVKYRMKSIFENKWQNVNEIMRFNKENGVPSTFFIGVSKGRYLCYSLEQAQFWIKRIKEEGFDVGVHGIAYNNIDDIKREYEIFRKISGLDCFGIRMHYLMNSENTGRYLSDVGYFFDSTVYEMKNPFRVGKMWEFPLHIMDGYILCENSRWQNRDLEQAKEATKKIIEEAISKNIKYFTILFHDRYFNDSFKTWKDWYVWVINYLKEYGCEFINYSKAIKELSLHKETVPYEKVK